MTAGIGAGLGVGIPLLVVIGVLSFLLVKNKAKVRDLQQRLNTVGPSPAYQEHKTEAYHGVSEVQSGPERAELLSKSRLRPYELQ